jgi:hypothetical protein
MNHILLAYIVYWHWMSKHRSIVIINALFYSSETHIDILLESCYEAFVFAGMYAMYERYVVHVKKAKLT